jgi:hypothetical protein
MSGTDVRFHMVLTMFLFFGVSATCQQRFVIGGDPSEPFGQAPGTNGEPGHGFDLSPWITSLLAVSRG